MKFDKICLLLSLTILITIFSWITSCTHVANIANIPEVCFTSDILPIFTSNCAISGCHDGGGRESRLSLSSYSEIIKGVTIISKWGNMMPPNKPLSFDNRTKIRIWIEQGAKETVCTDTTGTGGGGGGGTPVVARACFTRDILPVIISRCATTGCHDANAGGERANLTSYTNIMRLVSPGNPTSSRLYTIIKSGSGESKMPPANSPQLSVAEIDSIGKWIGYGALNENCGEVCDTINPVTFSGTIWPVIQTSCTGCHSGTSPSGNVLLASYSNVATVASSGLLLNSLNGTGVPKMPVGSSLSACRIRQFDMWIKNGFLNN